MPPSALNILFRMTVDDNSPYMFKLTNPQQGKSTHCGVLEFIAPEGHIYLPYWMMENLLLQEGDSIHLEKCTLPTATYAKFQPLDKKFTEICNPKAVLENVLRNFSALTQGDTIAIFYNDHEYNLLIKELRPANAVNIVECDLNLEFEAAPGTEHDIVAPKEADVPEAVVGTPDMKKDIEDYLKKTATFTAFTGSGNRLDGKKKNTKAKALQVDWKSVARGVPNYDWSFGTIGFIRNNEPPKDGDEADDSLIFEPFSGDGNFLKKKRSKSKK